jgi:LuxR family maltose regulon positive regulatory protein
MEQASLAYAEAVRIGQAAGNIHMVIIASTNLADVLMKQGELHQAARLFTETLQLATRPDGSRSPLADRVYTGLSSVSYEWNHLDAAGRYIHNCIELSQQWGNFDLLAEAYVISAQLELAQCHPENVQGAIHLLEQLAGEHRLSPRRSVWVKSALARLWIAQGNLERATLLIQQSGISIDDISIHGEIQPQHEPAYLARLHLLVAEGEHNAALALSERLLHKAEIDRRVGKVIEILALRALAFQGNRDLDQALATLERAVSLAEPEGYMRTFLDEGEPMVRLLKACRFLPLAWVAPGKTGCLRQSRRGKVEGLSKQYVEGLLLAFHGRRSEGSELHPLPVQAEMLIEPLTSRELEVLKLIEAGCANQEIADKLVISITTVKRHISNIYTKLDVTSRTQAISRGRLLSLFK